jgi:hypothetical protein
MNDLPRAVRHAPRELFSREDTEFTPWLEDNIDRISETLDLSLTVIERERDTPTGFSVDLFVEDEDSGQEGVIECQLEPTDHDHLGKLLAYSTAFDTDLVIWVVRDARYEHEKTIDWLNESTEKYFHLVKIEAIEIAGEMAPLFTPLASPSPEVKEIGETKREPSDRDKKQERFWTELLDRSGDFTLFDNITPKKASYLTKGAGVSGVKYIYRIRNGWGDSGLYIDVGDKELNGEVFDELHAEREEIESELDHEVEWHRLEDSRACRITLKFDSYGLEDDDHWPQVQNDMIEAMKEVHSVFGPKIEKLSV